MVSDAQIIELSYSLEPKLDDWVLPEIPVPESHAHDLLLTYLAALLRAFADRSERDALVARNLAVRWRPERPSVGVDPDIAWIEPSPPEPGELTSLCLWKPGHVAPSLCIEVVSESHPYKDYSAIQDKYAACGVSELWVLDPLLLGPARLGGPLPLQVWRSSRDGIFRRVFAGLEPYRSEVLPVWLRVSDGEVRLSDDEAGLELWLTHEETHRADAERERTARQVAEQRLQELEAKLGSKG